MNKLYKVIMKINFYPFTIPVGSVIEIHDHPNNDLVVITRNDVTLIDGSLISCPVPKLLIPYMITQIK